MIKTLIKTTIVAIVGARIIPAVFAGVMNTQAAMLTARILFVAFVGLSPLLVATAVVSEEMKPNILPMRLTPVVATPPRGAELRLEDFAPSSELRSVHFDFDRAGIRSPDQKTLDANIEWLKANPTYAILIEGGADPRGTPKYNLSLAERRAQAVRDYLVARGIATERITIVSAGDVKPACRMKGMKGEECWSLDRRADFLVKGLPKQAP